VATGTRPKFHEKLRLVAGEAVDRLLGLT
jgi:hypothetical protein